MASYSVLGGGFNFKFVDDMPQIAENMIDVNHWYNPNSASGQAMRKRTEADGKYFTFEVYCAYMSILFLADGFERAGTTDKDAVNAALAASTLVDFMPHMIRPIWSTARIWVHARLLFRHRKVMFRLLHLQPMPLLTPYSRGNQENTFKRQAQWMCLPVFVKRYLFYAFTFTYYVTRSHY